MTELADRIARLSPEKRAALMFRLGQQQAQHTAGHNLTRREKARHNPLSFAQQRLWFLDRFEPESPFYNVPAAVRLTGPLNVGALTRSLNEIVRRHDVLRTTFDIVNGEPVQVVVPELRLDVPVAEVPDGLDREALVRAIAMEEGRRPFDLTHGPLLRARLLRLDAADHVLLLTLHHIVYDGWSTKVLVHELSELYRAFSQGLTRGCSGLTSPLPELPVQYVDYAHWQRDTLQGEILERQLAYWEAALAGAPAVLTLPTDHPRPPLMAYRGAHHRFALPHDLVAAVKAFSQRESVTPFITLLAVFQALLQRYTGEDDICVGSPVANRTQPELEPLIGCFINTLVIRTDLSGAPSLRELLARVRQRTLEAQDHQDLPFEMLVETLRPQRDMSHTPLFQVFFDLQSSSLEGRGLRFGDLELRLLEIESGVAKFDLALTLIDDAGADMIGEFGYNTDLFEPASIQRMARHFVNLLAACVTAPDRPLTSLPILSPDERDRLVHVWNATDAEYPQDKCFHEAFEAQVVSTPEAGLRQAVVYKDDSLTYQSLNRRANQVARYLRRLGAGPERIIGLAAERSTDLIVGMLAIQKAGAAYLPLDPAYPQERLAFMLEDSGASLLLSQERLLSRMLVMDMPVVCLDRDWDLIAGEEMGNLNVTVAPDNLAYVIYTSGSTGRPKGVMIQHRSMLHLAAALHRSIYEPNLEGPLRISLNAPVSFDASVQQLVMLAYGHTLHIISQNARQDGAVLVAYVRRHRLHVLDCVPTQLKLLLDNGLLDDTAWMPRAVLPGGEAIDVPTWMRLKAAPNTEFYNMYGPTECTVDSTIGWVRASPESPTIGKPVTNAQLYILDANLQPVPVGVAGELYIGGAGVGRGYLNRAGLTAERFVPNLFSREGGARLYRTGDLARYLPDGHVEFLGRVDHQIKIHGFRIELGEIESVLKAHGDVHESVVLAREDAAPDGSGFAGSGDKRLVAYCVPEPGTDLKVDVLRGYLKEQLPEYMVPSAFVMLAALPLTPNGKIDRRALPAPEQVRPELSTAYVPAQTELQHYLASVWQSVLKVEQVGIHDDFFALGGDSIRAAVVSNALRQGLDAKLSVKAIFLAPTIAGLEAYLEEHHPQVQQRFAAPAGERAPGAGIPRLPRDGELKLSSAQQRLWFLEHLEPGSPLYTIAGGLRMRGALNVEALERSLNEIVRRHEVLRTSFDTVDGKPALAILPNLRLPLPLVDLTGLPEHAQEAEVGRLAAEGARRPFRLEQAPLLRVILLRLGAEEHVILLTMHHIISDGWSMGVLTRELAALYEAYTQEGVAPAHLPELPVQYIDYAHWQHDRSGAVQGTSACHAASDEDLIYWQAALAGAPALLELPLDHPRPAVQTANGAVSRFTVPAAVTQALRDLAPGQVTLFMTLMAAFQVLLYRYSGQDDICLGTPIANRPHADLEHLIGFFANTLVIRGDLSGSPDFRELLRRIRDVTVEAYAHANVPFDTVVDALHPERNLSYAPLFQAMFAFQNALQDEFALPGLALTPLDVDTGTAKFDLSLSVSEREGALQAALEYNTDLFEPETAARMARHFQGLLQSIITHPDEPVDQLSLLTEAERDQILFAWNATTVPYPQVCAHQVFETHVEQTPDAVALMFQDQVLTYRELNRRANLLAHRLQASGVGPEKLVGLCVERSPDMIIAILAVLKAGGAYVPLDPDYPQERLDFMVEDSQVSVLLTQPELRERLTAATVPVLYLDTEQGPQDPAPEENPASTVSPDNLAYVIYTSGSTGKPKGVLVEHHSLCNTARAYIRGFDVGPGSRVLQFFSFSFDGSVADIFTALLSGATLCLVPSELMLPGPGLNDLLRRQAVSFAVLTPSALAALPVEDHLHLRTLITGGESCTLELVRRWASGRHPRASGRRFFNAYGPTEAAVAASWYEVVDAEVERHTIPIGRPLDNARLYILDGHMQPVPVGVVGELYIGGAGVARGYLNRPELTRERFLDDPFHAIPGARMYKTGDLARYRPDGNVEFLGRIDDQVKLRGFRVELGEIEARLRAHPAVQDAVVLAREDTVPGGTGSGVKRLVAYVVPQGQLPPVGELRDFLAARLPDYMVPAFFVTLETMPITPAGKVDRRALPAPDLSRPDLGTSYVAPRSREEEVLAGIWAQVLGIAQVGVHDNFFELGGDSILSIQVVARANQAGLHVNPRQLFQAPTVAALAAVAGKVPTVHAEQGVVTGPVPLTPIQRWFFEQAFADLHHWNQAFLLETGEPIHLPAFTRALTAVLAHHDALRMKFTQGTVGWQQANADVGGDPPFERIDLSALPEDQRAVVLRERVAQAQASLDLEQGPLLRVVNFDMGVQQPGRLLIVIHHLVIDGVSWRFLIEDLLLGYHQSLRGQEIRLPDKTTSFKEWAERLTEYAQSEEVRRELDYWSALPPSAAPESPGGENREAMARQVVVRLEREETQHLLRDVHGAYGTEINDVLLTALIYTFAATTGQHALLVDLEGHGREHLFAEVDVSRTVGWFTTLYPVYLDLGDIYEAGAPGREAGAGQHEVGRELKAIKEQLRAVPRKGIGYGLLRYFNADLSRQAGVQRPNAEISFNYLGQFDQVLAATGLFALAPEPVGYSRSPSARRSHALDVVGAIVDGRLQLEWTYSTAQYHPATIARLADTYVDALRRIIAHCLSPDAVGYTPSDFPEAALSEDELDALILEMEG